MKYDGELDIAVGSSYKTVLWSNRKISWGDLVERLSKPTIIKLTHTEYRDLPKAKQVETKDVGGYVGGFLKSGKRHPQNVLHKQLITLDIDTAYSSMWEDIICTYDNAMLVHSTFSSLPELPRYRLIIPLSRQVEPEEYEAIARRVAGDIGIQYFDETTFQLNRLMFWPATPKDIELYVEVQDGPWLDPDTVLARYKDWKDILEWPRGEKVNISLKEAVDKQQDPFSKPGIIGAFCRAYSISEALDTFLPDLYIKIDEGRYTYSKGSTAGGVLVYDDKFSFSHHGSDPTSNRLCNSFDLVRIHKFGHLDVTAKTKKDSTKKSFKKMEELILQDLKVKKQLLNENSDTVFKEAAWIEKLDVDRAGRFISSSKNINTILVNDENINKAFAFNKFDRKVYLLRSMIWRDISEAEPIKDLDLAGLRNYLDVVYSIVSSAKIDDAFHLEAERNAFHPIVDYISKLEWDGVKRVDTLFPDYFGATENIYSAEAARVFLTAAIARVFEPGIKYDLVITVVGTQGTGKSTFFKRLGQDWFSDTFTTFQGKEAFEQLQGVWLLEMAELSGLRKADLETVKQFISKSEDTYRPAYGRVVETYPRQCVFVGTTNEADFLQDPTGNRRFIPVDSNMNSATKSIFSDLTKYEVDQLWAEAFNLYNEGQVLMMSREASALAKIEQEKHTEYDERTGLVLEYLNTLLPTNWEDLDIFERRDFLNGGLTVKGTEERQEVCVAEIWCECFNKNKDDMTRYNTKDISTILRKLPDWNLSKTPRRFNIYGMQRFYYRD